MSAGQKPVSVVLMETSVLLLVGAGSIIGMLTDRLSSDSVTLIWGMLLAYAFKNGYQYLSAKGQVIGGGNPPEPTPSLRS